MHYDPDGRVGRTMSSSDGQLHRDQMWALKFVLKLAVFPAWIFVVWLKRRHRRQEMARFAETMLQPGNVTAREIAVKWAEAHHRDYPFAEYSANLPKLVAEFEQIIGRSPKLTRRSLSS